MCVLITRFVSVVVLDNWCVNYSALFPFHDFWLSKPNCLTIYRIFSCAYVVGVCRGSEVGAEVPCGLAIITCKWIENGSGYYSYALLCLSAAVKQY